MRILIGRTFYHEKQDKTYIKGKNYPANNEFAEWIIRKRLGIIIPEVKKKGKADFVLKEMKGPPEDKMMKKVKTK